MSGIQDVMCQKVEQFVLEYPCDSPSASRWCVVTATPLAGRSGAVLSHVDVTEGKRIAQNLAEERNLLRTLIDNLPDLIFAKDAEGRFLLANAPTARHMGAATSDDLLGKTNFDFYPAEMAADLQSTEEKVIKTGESIVALEEPTVDAEGREGWLSTTKVPIRDRGGKIVGLVGIGRNITEQRRQEESRKVLELELQQVHKLESIGRLAAGIAHEINTPTQFISDNQVFLRRAFTRLLEAVKHVQLLLEAAKSGAINQETVEQASQAFRKAKIDYLVKEVPRALDQAGEGLDRVARIVGAMKEFSHPSQGQIESIDLSRAIESTLTVARNEWKYIANVVKDFDPQMPPVRCIRDEFNQVILNMVVNAAHAISERLSQSKETKGTITLQTRLIGKMAEVRISDTGVGIPADIREKIFEPFFTTKGVGKGTGQGLAIAWSVIVDKLGGWLGVESQEGQGTTFVIQLPLDGEAREGGTKPA